MFAFTYLSVQKAVQNCNDETLRKREEYKTHSLITAVVEKKYQSDITAGETLEMRVYE